MTSAVFASVLLYYGYRGYRLGFGLVIARIASLLIAYALALCFSSKASEIVIANSKLDGMLATVVGAGGLFFASLLICYTLFRMILLLQSRGRMNKHGAVSTTLGALSHSVVGAFIALSLVWLLNVGSSMLTEEDSVNKNQLDKLADEFMGFVFENVMARQWEGDSQMASISTHLLMNPAQAINDVQLIIDNPDLKALLSDPVNQAAIRNGDAERLAETAAFERFFENAQVQEMLHETQILGEFDNKQSMKTAMSQELTRLWGNVERVKQHPEFQEIMLDPQFQRLLQGKDLPQLINDGRFTRVVGLIASADKLPEQQELVAENVQQVAELAHQPEPTPVTIHRWRDENGQIHFSDRRHDGL